MYLLWTALNGVVLLYFAASSLYALQLIWQRLGRWPLLVLLLGLYSWGSSAHKSLAHAPTSPPQDTWAPHAGVPTHLAIALEKHYLNELTLVTTYWERPATTGGLPSRVYFTGFRLGTMWHAQLAEVTIKSNCLTYNVQGTMDWRLLGVTLYQEPKHLSGLVPLEVGDPSRSKARGCAATRTPGLLAEALAVPGTSVLLPAD